MPVKLAIKNRANEPNNIPCWRVYLATKIQAGISALYSTVPHRYIRLFGTFSNISITVLQYIAEDRGDTGQRWERFPEAVEGKIKLQLPWT